VKFSVITLFPEMIQSLFQQGILSSAIDKKIIDIVCINPREETTDVHRTIDDRPFGGGDGMILMAEPLKALLTKVKTSDSWTVYMSPQGTPLDNKKAQELAKKKDLILVCGRYGGIDQRIINQFVDEEISIGDYVLSGGELAAAVVIDAVSRQIPGVLGHHESANFDSFSEKLSGLLEAPAFTRPRQLGEVSVPEVLLSGNHKKIEEWKKQVSRLVTLKKRPDLLKLSDTETKEMKAFWQSLPASEKSVLGLENLTHE
jgi:tRNA (guanine37-N1)-methyltransferase